MNENTQDETQVNDSVLLERMIKNVEREDTAHEHEELKAKVQKDEQADTLHDWLEEAVTSLSKNAHLEPLEHKHDVTLHVGVFDEPGKGRLTRTYNITVKVVNNEDEYMIEKINYDWRGLSSSYHREIDSFEDLRDYFLKEIAREIVFVRKHEELAVFKFPEDADV